MEPYLASISPLEISLIGAAVCYAAALPCAAYMLYDSLKNPKKDIRRANNVDRIEAPENHSTRFQRY